MYKTESCLIKPSLKDTHRILVEHNPMYWHYAQDGSQFVVKLNVFSVFRGPAEHYI